MRYIMTAIALLTATPALSEQMQCASVDQAYTTLTEQYGEARVVAGYTESGATLEFWLNPNGQSWTVILVVQDKACIVADGKDWTFDVPKQGDKT